MKLILRFSALLLCLGLSHRTLLFSQICLVDTQFQSPGIYPSDTLPDLHANVLYDEVVQFVIAPDTVLFGFTLVWDSIEVISLTNLPASVNWDCNVNTCRYQGNGIDPFRFCLRLAGTPIDTSLGMAGWDSILVGIGMYITLPFGPNPTIMNFPLYYRKGQLLGISSELLPSMDLKVNPNPVAEGAWVTFVMQQAGNVDISLSDAFGREVQRMSFPELEAGNQKIAVPMAALPSGIYMLRLINQDDSMSMRRVLKL